MLVALCPAAAEISGSTAATGWYRGSPVISAPAGATVGVVQANPRLAVEVRPLSTAFLRAGEVIAFEVLLANRGNVSLREVELSVPEARSCLDRIAALAPGDAVSCRLEVTVGESDLRAGAVTIEASGHALDPDGHRVTVQARSTGIAMTQSDLVTIVSLANDAAISEGEPVSLAVTLRNEGPEPASGIQLAIALPDGLTYLGHGGGGFDVTDGRWEIAQLPVGDEERLVLDLLVEPGTTGRSLPVAAHVVALDQHDGRSDGDRNRAVLSVPAADLETEIRLDAAGPLRVGDAIGILARVRNLGPDPATEIDLEMPVPEGVALNGAESDRGAYRDGVWRIGRLSAGEEAALRLQGTVNMAAAGGNIVFTAKTGSATGDPHPDGPILPDGVAVSVPVLRAVADHAEGLDGVAGAARFLNLLANDRMDGRPMPASDVVVTTSAKAPFSLDADGWLSLAPGAAAGRHEFEYRSCLRLLPTICAEASVRIEVEAPAAISGIVFRDRNGSGAFEPDADQATAGFSVSLLSQGRRMARAVTGFDGAFRFPSLPASVEYRILVHDPQGTFAGGVAGLEVDPGERLGGLEIAVDPTGIVYDAVNRQPLAGALVVLADADGNVLPPACLLDPEPVSTSEDGGYRIALAAGADPSCPEQETIYRLRVSPPPGYEAAPSVLLPALSGAASLGECPFDAVPGGLCTAAPHAHPPAVGSPATYLLRFSAGAGDRMILHNHIPLDPSAGSALAELTARVGDPEADGAIPLAVDAENVGSQPLAGLTLDIVLPAGFTYVAGSAHIGSAEASPVEGTALVSLPELAVEPGQRLAIRMAVLPQPGLTPGDYAVRMRLFDPARNPVSAEARALIGLAPDRISICTSIAGRVFVDGNRNGLDDSDEPGLAGVEIFAGGASTRTDHGGYYRLNCRDMERANAGSSVMVEVDAASLPAGYRLRSASTQTVGPAAGETAVVSFAAETGRLVRLEISRSAFEEQSTTLQPRWRNGIEDLVDTLGTEFSVLTIRYHRRDPLADARLLAVAEAVHRQWRAAGNPYPLAIRTEIVD